MKYIEGIDRKRKFAFPEYIDDYIAEDNPVRVMDAFVDSLDIVKMGYKNANPSDTGRPGFDPRVLLKLYISHIPLNCTKSAGTVLFAFPNPVP